MTRVLIPYFVAGFGHLSLARAIEGALRERRPGLDIRLLDLGVGAQSEALERLYVRSWQKLLALPRAVQSVLYFLNALFPWGFKLANGFAIRRALPVTRAFLREERPDAIMSTHWGCCHVLDRARRAEGLDTPLYFVYGELAGAFPPILCGADVYFCPTDDVREALVRIGVPRDRVVRIGLVVQPELRGDPPPQREARRALGLREDRFTVLFSLGGEGIGRCFPFLDHYSCRGQGAQILVLTGRNDRLLQALKARYPQRPDRALIVPLGFLPSLIMPYAAADILAGKCGTAFAMEAIAARKMLLINNLGAPNEADNRDYLVRHGFAAYTKRPVDFTAAVDRIAAETASGAAARESSSEIANANGAADIASYLLDRLEERE